MSLIRANTNDTRKDFEMTATALIDMDPYHRFQRASQGKAGANISSIDFSAGRGKTGVDLRWHHPQEFKALPSNQKDELVTWQKSQDGQKTLDKSRMVAEKKRKQSGGNGGGGIVVVVVDIKVNKTKMKDLGKRGSRKQ